MSDRPRVALESTIIAHGFPYPDNEALAIAMERAVKLCGAEAATIAILDGEVKVGLTHEELHRVATEGPKLAKASAIDIGRHLAKKTSAATTVSATARLAHEAGIDVFATGGIGGVHRGDSGDVSHDLYALAKLPIVVVSAGAKAILDLPKTQELLESLGVLVLGYQCSEFPAFYSRSSGLPLEHRVDDYREIATTARAHWEHGGKAILVCNPIPLGAEIPRERIEPAIEAALGDPMCPKRGKGVTPFLLAKLAEVTLGLSVRANRELALSNASLGGAIATALAAR